jgi:hypothetical protein
MFSSLTLWFSFLVFIIAFFSFYLAINNSKKIDVMSNKLKEHTEINEESAKILISKINDGEKKIIKHADKMYKNIYSLLIKNEAFDDGKNI